MKNLVCESKMDTREDLIRRIVDVATHINDQDILRCVPRYVVRRESMCIEAEGGLL
jgi:hypothetical protein